MVLQTEDVPVHCKTAPFWKISKTAAERGGSGTGASRVRLRRVIMTALPRLSMYTYPTLLLYIGESKTKKTC